MRNVVYIAQSLDGYIADKNGGIDWLTDIPNPGNSDFGYADFINNIDAIVMGRNTFNKILTFGDWPYTKPVYVISSSLDKVPDGLSDKVTILNTNPADAVKRINQEGHNNLYIDGGLLIQSFLSADLIDELILTTIPILLGGGIPLFGELDNPMKFSHVKTEVLVNSLVKSCYKRLK
jgi:dihydrofolate reductase